MLRRLSRYRGWFRGGGGGVIRGTMKQILLFLPHRAKHSKPNLKMLICLFTIFRTLPKFSLTHCQNVLNVTVKNIAWMFINTLLTILCEVSLRASTLLKKIATFSPIHWKHCKNRI